MSERCRDGSTPGPGLAACPTADLAPLPAAEPVASTEADTPQEPPDPPPKREAPREMLLALRGDRCARRHRLLPAIHRAAPGGPDSSTSLAPHPLPHPPSRAPYFADPDSEGWSGRRPGGGKKKRKKAAGLAGYVDVYGQGVRKLKGAVQCTVKGGHMG